MGFCDQPSLVMSSLLAAQELMCEARRAWFRFRVGLGVPRGRAVLSVFSTCSQWYSSDLANMEPLCHWVGARHQFSGSRKSSAIFLGCTSTERLLQPRFQVGWKLPVIPEGVGKLQYFRRLNLVQCVHGAEQSYTELLKEKDVVVKNMFSRLELPHGYRVPKKPEQRTSTKGGTRNCNCFSQYIYIYRGYI